MDQKIQDALLIALRALPKQIHIGDQEPERYRVEKSADVTAHCRRLGLLTEAQYISYSAYYPPDRSYGHPRLIPCARDENGRATYLPGGTDVERDLEVPEDEELRAEFLAIKDPHHPLGLHQRSPFGT